MKKQKNIGKKQNHKRNQKKQLKEIEMKRIIREKKKTQKKTIGNEENQRRNDQKKIKRNRK